MTIFVEYYMEWFCVQRIVRMNKTEDDEMDAEELTDEELRQVAGLSWQCLCN